MNRFFLRVSIVVGVVLTSTAASPPYHTQRIVSEDVGLQFFHDELALHGKWVETKTYGQVWTPNHKPLGWQPYTVGHWEYTNDHGWLWASDWEWGWAPFHYGRWVFDDFQGWAWIPGTEWGPAWVAWRSGNGYVGWAPLPPHVKWNAEVGLGGDGFDISVQIHPRYWSFVEERLVMEPHLHKHRVRPARKIVLLRRTKDSTRYVVADGRIVNRGLHVEHIERAVGRRIPRRTVRVLESSTQRRRAVVRGNEITLFRPKELKRAKTHSTGVRKVLRKVSEYPKPKYDAASRSTRKVVRKPWRSVETVNRQSVSTRRAVRKSTANGSTRKSKVRTKKKP